MGYLIRKLELSLYLKDQLQLSIWVRDLLCAKKSRYLAQSRSMSMQCLCALYILQVETDLRSSKERIDATQDELQRDYKAR